MIHYFKCWNAWRKYNKNSTLYKFLVLIGVAKSPTLMAFLIVDDVDSMSVNFFSRR